MYPVTQDYLDKITETDRTISIDIRIEHSKGTLNLSDEDIAIGTVVYREGSQSGDDFTIGGAVASDISFTLINKPEYDDITFMGATVYVTFGLIVQEAIDAHFLQPSQPSKMKGYEDKWEYVPLGKFHIDYVERMRNIIELKGIDNMINLDKPYSLSKLSYPATLYQIYTNICNVADVPIGTLDFPNKNYVVRTRPQDDVTLRDMLQYVAELAGCFAKCNRNGSIELKWYTPTDITLTPEHRSNFRPSDDVVSIKGIMATVEDTVYIAGSEEYAVDLTNNPLLQGDYETVLPNILNHVKDTTFTPYTSDWRGDPSLQAGDMLTHIDIDGNVYDTLITHSTYRFRGKCTLEAKGLPDMLKGNKGELNKQLSEIRRKIDVEVGDKLTTLEEQQLQATELIANMLGGYAIKTDDAFYIADNEDLSKAMKVWKWGLGGFGYSENGVDGPYTAAITADGSIVAMLVAANIVAADMVRTGILQSEDGSTWINLNDGSFNFKDTLKWDNTAIQIVDDENRERVRLGNYASGKYGLLLKDATGTKTILDENGILQSWQEGRTDNIDTGKPLRLSIFLPSNTRNVNQAILRFKREYFRAYSTSTVSGGGGTRTSSSGGSYDTTSSSGGGTTATSSSEGGYTTSTYSGGADTVTSGDSGVDVSQGWEWTVTPGEDHEHRYWHVTGHKHRIYLPNHSHDIYISSHDHTVRIPSHRHDIYIPSHRHDVEIPDHTHGIKYGIYESTRSTNITITINGTNRTSALGGGTGFNSDQSNLNITPYLLKGRWNTIDIGGTGLGRIDATVFIQALMNI